MAGLRLAMRHALMASRRIEGRGLATRGRGWRGVVREVVCIMQRRADVLSVRR